MLTLSSHSTSCLCRSTSAIWPGLASGCMRGCARGCARLACMRRVSVGSSDGLLFPSTTLGKSCPGIIGKAGATSGHGLGRAAHLGDAHVLQHRER